MAKIYSPWENPPANDIVLASKEFEAPMPATDNTASDHEAPHGDMMQQALATIQQQSQLIRDLMQRFTGARGE